MKFWPKSNPSVCFCTCLNFFPLSWAPVPQPQHQDFCSLRTLFVWFLKTATSTFLCIKFHPGIKNFLPQAPDKVDFKNRNQHHFKAWNYTPNIISVAVLHSHWKQKRQLSHLHHCSPIWNVLSWATGNSDFLKTATNTILAWNATQNLILSSVFMLELRTILASQPTTLFTSTSWIFFHRHRIRADF